MLGVAGAIISTAILYYSYTAIFLKFVDASLGFLGFTLITPYFILGTVLWQFILGGLLIGAVGSVIAIRKFLIV
jgi:cell division transport system permease protein